MISSLSECFFEKMTSQSFLSICQPMWMMNNSINSESSRSMLYGIVTNRKKRGEAMEQRETQREQGKIDGRLTNRVSQRFFLLSFLFSHAYSCLFLSLFSSSSSSFSSPRLDAKRSSYMLVHKTKG